MAKMGRPAVEEPKDKRVSMRVTEKDYQRIVAYAEKQKITVAELISRAVKAYIETAQQYVWSLSRQGRRQKPQ